MFQEMDEGVSCTVRSLSDKTVVFQGNVNKDTGCTEEMIQHYNYLADKTFRLGNSRSVKILYFVHSNALHFQISML